MRHPFAEPPRWRWIARRRWREACLAAAARNWQQEAWEWSQLHPGIPVLEVVITREGSLVTWNGPELRG